MVTGWFLLDPEMRKGVAGFKNWQEKFRLVKTFTRNRAKNYVCNSALNNTEIFLSLFFSFFWLIEILSTQRDLVLYYPPFSRKKNVLARVGMCKHAISVTISFSPSPCTE